MPQAQIDHPLSKFGYKRPPHWLWRISQRLYIVVAALNDIRLIAMGRLTLHRAWQAGHDHGHAQEIARCLNVANNHLARVPGHTPDNPMADLVAQGYGNAALNIGCEIKRR